MVIYTNNVGPNGWIDMIKNCRFKQQLFDKIIRL